MRLGLAIRAFFAILFGKPLPVELAPPAAELPETTTSSAVAEAKAALEEVAEEAVPEPEPEPEAPPPPAPAPEIDISAKTDAAAVAVLSVLQAEGRLLDFLSEDIDDFDDADVGAVVRDVHKGLRKALAEHFPVEPIKSEDEDDAVTVPEGFDPSHVRLVGNVVGEPPFSGTLKHKGWKVGAIRLPNLPDGDAAKVAAPAEVEL